MTIPRGAATFIPPLSAEEYRIQRRLRGRRPRYRRFYTPFGSPRNQRVNLGVWSLPAKLFLGVIITRKTRGSRRHR